MRFVISILFSFTLLCANTALAAQFMVKSGAPNEVTFTSKATSETFQGKTNHMDGSITVDPAQVGDSVTVHIAVDLTTLDTGISKRDQHMRENHLETNKYPKATFDGVSVKTAGATLAVGTPMKLDVEGNFTLHGVTKRLRTTVDVLLKDAHTLTFSTNFPVLLADYKIDRPTFLFLKLGEVQEISVSGIAIAK